MVKEIQLTQGKVALVDDADYEWLNQWKWCANNQHGHWYAHRGYRVNGKNQIVTMHALILGTPKGMDSDHKDGEGLNNQRQNLRVCTTAQNQQNRRVQLSAKSSMFKGVCWDKENKKWLSQIGIAGIQRKLGRFTSEIQAALAYDRAAKKYFGEFANLNFIEV